MISSVRAPDYASKHFPLFAAKIAGNSNRSSISAALIDSLAFLVNEMCKT
jgi:hypothetical protein